MSLSGPFQSDSTQADRQHPPASAYPSRQEAAKGHPVGRQLLLVQAIKDRLCDPRATAAGRLALAEFMFAVAKDRNLSLADALQVLTAIGHLCPLHLTEFSGDDVHGRFCLSCEFNFAETRYRGHAEIPFAAGEVIDPRDLFDEADFSDCPGFPQ